MGYIYTGKEPNTPADTTPDLWPDSWDYPLSYPYVWPPGWPLTIDSVFTTTVTMPASISSGAATSIVARILDAGVDTSDLDLHTIQVTAAIGATTVQLKTASGSYADRIVIVVSNYTGLRYGFSENLYFDTTPEQAGSTLTVTTTIVSVVSNVIGNTTGTIATALEIVTQPEDADAIVGQTKTFTVAASGAAPITYQWKKDGVTIGGATSTSYTTPATVIGDHGADFTCVVTNGSGSITSSAAELTVHGMFLASLNYYSEDGSTFLANTLITGAFQSIAYSPELGLFAGISYSGGFGESLVYTSTDGRNWTGQSVPAYTGVYRQYKIVWANTLGMFVVIVFRNGQSDTIYSYDGETWNLGNGSIGNGVDSGATNKFSMAWSEDLGILAAVGNRRSTAYSNNGIDWTQSSAAISGGDPLDNWNQMVWSSALGGFYAYGFDFTATKKVAISTNGTSWSAVARTGFTALVGEFDRGLAWSEDLSLMVWAKGRNIYTSTNGIAFTLRLTLSSGHDFQGGAWSPTFGKFLMSDVSSSGGLYTSSGGISWANVSSFFAYACVGV